MPTPRETWELAGALLDREPVDWARIEGGEAVRDRALLRALRSLSTLFAARPDAGTDVDKPPARVWSPWVAAILATAAFHVLLGIVGFAIGYTGSSPVSSEGAIFVTVVFAAAAGWLFAGGRGDLRAARLGGFFLLVGASFARRYLGIATDTPLNAVVTGVFPDAFLPAFLWSFVSRFPRALRFSAADRVCRAAVRISVVSGTVLFGWNLLMPYIASAPSSHVLHRGHPLGIYWAVVLGLCLSALPLVAVRARLAPRDERRRVALFCGVLIAAVSPVVTETLAEISVPGFRAWMSQPGVRRLASYGLFAVLLLLPIGTTYAVLVERILDVRLVVGRALQYLLARGLLIVLSTAPFGLLVVYGSRHREAVVGDLFTSASGVVLVLLAGTGIVLLSARSRALAFVDRVFMRAPVDLAAELTRLAAELIGARSTAEALELGETAIARATGTDFVRFYFQDPAVQAFLPARGIGYPLPAASACAVLMGEDPAPLPIGRLETGTVATLLPEEEARWTSESGAAVLVPLMRGSDPLIGFLQVGPKRNGLSFEPAELSFLRGASGAVALALGSTAGAIAPTSGIEAEPARECIECGMVVSAATSRCVCGAVARLAAIPSVLNGKFKVDRRLGSGGMGVVYRALDTSLDRQVALKTLSRLSATAAGQLAREARVMAAVVHPHLSTIYGVERWRGAPVLVVEFFEGGTLADRLRSQPLPVADVLRVGLQLARGLGELHAAGVLHRDVKPSNIGFRANGTAKLLDFGIASFASARPLGVATSGDDPPLCTQTIELGQRSIAGTPLYVSPEVLCGTEPDARLDLWALALVLYEAVSGRHPFAAATVPDVLSRVRRARIPDVRQLRPDCPDGFARALSRWLAHAPSDRPSTADHVAAELQALIDE
jgi:hypothetical protein